ncbi:nucleoporin autopeptidase-domain-containing protein [Fusarium oxysporum II5]|uniref:Peptidase S59 domain-containing protein n=1 Tax=Fusarium odoratissimum (strain NRRL 54006) TaxID=1089451 RepID=X0IZU1_FUSO5|nr:uncharacterized protein FOIG_12657 [Fusarium odoratissimum NRRL 54006]EXL94463.1 hypothetical protein FOIG_12657 [Fusarium odoratissimum NRRL 54006]KAK2122420.1 nucleoporin autopeptidase-domain-containing protein [Fusarium oxysporum II5]
MSEFGKKPFGQWQQLPTGFDAFGSNIHNSNHPVSSLGPRLSSSAPTIPPTTTGTGWLEHHSNTQGLTALSDPGTSNVTNHADSTGFGGGFFGSSAKKTSFSTGMSPSTAGFGSNAWTRFRTPTTSVFSAPSQSFGGWAWGIPATDTSKQPFSPFVESELGNRQKSSYQNVCFQGPYKSFSQEELRLADYALGHRYGLSFRFSGPSFGTGFGTSMQRSASGPPQTFGIGSQQGAFGTGFGSATTTTSPLAPSQQQAQGSTSFAEAQKPSSSQPPTGSIFRTDSSTAPNPFASAATQVSALSGPLSTSQRPWVTDRYSTTQAWQQATQLPSTEMPVGRVQVPQPFGQQTQYEQTGNLYYQVPGRPSSDIRLIQQPLQDDSRATIQPQLVAKIDEITAYGPPWLFLTTEEKQQQQDEGPLAVRRASKGKPRSQSVPAGFSFRSPRLAPCDMSPGSPRSSFRHALYPASYPVKRTLLSSDWMGPPDLGHELTRSPSRRGSDQRRTSEDTISTGGHRKGFNIVEKSFSQISKQLKTLEIDQDRGRDLFASSSKRRGQKESIGTTALTGIANPGREGGAKSRTPGTTTETSEHTSSPPSPGNTGNIRSRSGCGTKQNDESTAADSQRGEDLLAMDKDQRKRVTDLTIGRENVGVIRFKHPVDFTGIDLESLLGGLVILESRSATVYPDSFGLKPPPGEGLNVPASISLESPWPRKKTNREDLSEDEARRQVASHIERLKRVAVTSFESYSEEDGTWTFSVNHFSTYNQVMCNN